MAWLDRYARIGLAVGISLWVLVPGMASAQVALAKTPPMGWNSWNHFGCSDKDIKESLFKEMADAMVTSGMSEAGYKFLNVDDCWHGPRLPTGFISASANFTGGSMATLGKYVHDKGLKFGIYTCAGAQTCASRPGSLGYEAKDIQQYAIWGVDYVKVDWCSITPDQNSNPLAAYTAFSSAIKANAAVHPMVLSICNWGQKQPWFWGRSAGGQLWRTTLDIKLGFDSFTGIIDQEAALSGYAGPGATPSASGGWNDPDMLEVGRGMTQDEDKAHFGMWCMLAAPLIAGNDLRTMTNATKDILTNKEVIAVDQDSLGIQALRVATPGSNLEVWAKPLMGNSRAVALFNRTTAPASITFNWADLKQTAWESKGLTWTADKSVSIRDLWAHADLGTGKSGTFTVANVPAHGLAMLKLYDPSQIGVRRLPLGNRSWVEVGPQRIRVDYPGAYTLRVQDLRGRMIWSARASGPRSFPMADVGLAGTRLLRIETADKMMTARF